MPEISYSAKMSMDKARALADEYVNRVDMWIASCDNNRSDMEILRAYKAMQEIRDKAERASGDAMSLIAKDRAMPDELVLYELTGEFIVRKK